MSPRLPMPWWNVRPICKIRRFGRQRLQMDRLLPWCSFFGSFTPPFLRLAPHRRRGLRPAGPVARAEPLRDDAWTSANRHAGPRPTPYKREPPCFLWRLLCRAPRVAKFAIGVANSFWPHTATPPREHSRKPDEGYKRSSACMYPGAAAWPTAQQLRLPGVMHYTDALP